MPICHYMDKWYLLYDGSNWPQMQYLFCVRATEYNLIRFFFFIKLLFLFLLLQTYILQNVCNVYIA